MCNTPSAVSDPRSVQGAVSIHRPLEEVFAFYRDFANLPKFLGDVMSVQAIDRTTSRWTVQGPVGVRATWLVRVTDERTNRLLRYETLAPAPLRTRWTIHFCEGSSPAEARVREVLQLPLGWLGRVGLAMIGKSPAGESPSTCGGSSR